MTRTNNVSTISKIINIILRVVKPKLLLKWVFKNPPRSNSPLNVTAKFSKKYLIKYHMVGGTESMTASPINRESSIHIVYLHGGAYILGKNGVGRSEEFISRLIEGTEAKVTFIDYPVAPETCFTTTLASVYGTYIHLCAEYENDSFVFVGDSAGGGLALSLAQKVRDETFVRKPVKLVLFSPWIDLSMGDPRIKEQEKKDFVLSKEALIYAAEQYAGPENVMNPLVSPIYGDLSEIGESLIFFGTSELFYPDGLRLKEIAEENNYDIHLRFYNEMPHVWVLMPFPETKQALKESFDFILTY